MRLGHDVLLLLMQGRIHDFVKGGGGAPSMDKEKGLWEIVEKEAYGCFSTFFWGLKGGGVHPLYPPPWIRYCDVARDLLYAQSHRHG